MLSLGRGRVSALLLLLCMLSNPSMAEPLTGLKQVGAARLKVLFWNIYDSTLYSADGKYQQDAFPQALQLVYLRDIDAEELLKHTRDEWHRLGVPKQSAQHWLSQLKAIFPDIKEGDELTLRVSEQGHSEFYFNSQAIGLITEAEFGSAFLRIWLDENSSYPKVREQLIGQSK